ncbi:DNA-binding protein [Candidatus Micrarchaeota archaeon]|nr:DNA-binding protein [Candidatus Micrarchaeota archaeon]
MAKISELRPGMNDVVVTGKVVSVSQPRSVNTKYGQNTVADATIEDDSGTVSMTLWGQQASTIKEGASVEIRGAYTKEWNGEIQLNVGRSGEIKVL